MAQNFIESRREQGFLLPPDVRDWLASDHLAWFVIDAVAQMDLQAFYGAYRADGHGRAAYEPSMMVTLILYANATKVRSSRAIECHCRQDVAYRVITGNVVPDHATIARFVVRHEQALADLFSEVLRLCDEAGLVAPGVIAIDGTRLAGDASRETSHDFERIAREGVTARAGARGGGNASGETSHDFERIAREVLAEHKATDEAEDEQFGQARGDELPEQLRTPEGRREFFRKARQKQRDGAGPGGSGDTELEGSSELESSSELEGSLAPEYEFDPERIIARTQGRKGWLRDAERQLEQHRSQIGRAH